MKFVQDCFGRIVIAILAISCFCGTEVEAQSFAQKISIDSTGAGVAVWINESPGYFCIQAATKSAAGSWSPAVTLSAPGEDCSYPIVATSVNGASIALWSSWNTVLNLRVVKAAMLASPVSSWSAPTMISTAAEDVAHFVSGLMDDGYQLVINASGTAIASWSSTTGGALVIRASEYSGGIWSAPVTISP